MNCTVCNTEIEAELHIRNDHVYHERCAKIYDKDEKVNSYNANGC